ncbi:MAG: hypothetical protein L0Z50_42900 [Verrucomicrobiales bacterium]|nr:hypothetical protein [Verrucomicrobiales bacterium]
MNGPSCNHDVFALHGAAAREQIFKDGLRGNEKLPGLRFERDEHIHIESSHRFEIELGAHRAANGIAVNDAIGSHLVYGCDGLFDVHEFTLAHALRGAELLTTKRGPKEPGRDGCCDYPTVSASTQKRFFGDVISTPEAVAQSVPYTPDIRRRTVPTSSFLPLESAG